MSQCFDRIQSCGLAGREVTEHDADQSRERKCEQHDAWIDRKWDLQNHRAEAGEAETQDDADQSAEQRQHNGLGKELSKDLSL